MSESNRPVTGAELAEGQRSRAAKKKIAEFPIEELLCRTRGHKWPDLDPRKPLPKSFSARLQGNGTFMMIETCERKCAKFRYRLSGAGGVFSNVGQWQYGLVKGQEKNWVVLDEAGPEVFKSDMHEALYDQLADAVRRMARHA